MLSGSAVGMAKKQFNYKLFTKWLLVGLIFLAVILPLFFMFAQLSGKDVANVLKSELFLTSIGNSIAVGLTATVLSLILAFALAYGLSKTNVRFKNVMAVVITVPMLIPSIAHGMSLVILFGESGIFSISGASIYGFGGIVLGSVMYSFPTAFLMFSDILKYEDKSVYEAADIMGVPKWRQFKDITLPYLKKPIITIFFATFTLIFTDYGVPMMVGGKFMTLPLFMYNEVIGQLNFGSGALVAIVLLAPAIVACILDFCNKNTANMSTVHKYVPNKVNKKRDAAMYCFLVLTALFVLVPIATFAIIGLFNKYPSDMTLSGANISTAFSMGAGKYLLNSLVIAVGVGVLGTILSYTIAYFTARTDGKISNKILHLISIASLAVPGLVLGISYSLMFKGSILMGTVTIMLIVNIVHFFSSPYLMAYNALNKVNKNYEIIVKTMGISKTRYIADILLPETGNTVMEMFSYFFVNSMVTISAVSFLSTSFNKPLSLLINQFETQMLIECAAIVSTMIFIINGLLKLSVYLVKYRRIKKGD